MTKNDQSAETVKGMAADKSEASVTEAGTENLLDPRIRDGLKRLYAGVVNEPLPAKISDLLDKLRQEEQRDGADTKQTGGGGSENG